MSVKPRLVRYVDLVACLLALDGVGYAIAILLTPFQRGDLYTGAPVVYLGATLAIATPLLLLGMLMLLIAFTHRHPCRRRLVASYIGGLLLLALGLSFAHGWIAHRLA
ncbi:hypothetical protein LMG23992_02456 [Cupriavidus laharis]|uniref:Uncharacterized protein n=1 Tax=Cupriavidus laharis TaxID=151654 RepID=A0ABM8X0T2_9BURK|nr:hypothetical protein [Cupriavidus laharis]CAG9173451.1 hypothetical protein LMG23992_02456 [Cupriavidus laharis]